MSTLKMYFTGLLGLGLLLGATAAPPAAGDIPAFTSNARVLFQGDWITDGGRGRSADPNHVFGQDYAYLIAARFGAEFPDRHIQFFNRGVSGNTVNDLSKRWQTDTLDLKPDLLSILIGVNDLGHGVPADQYEQQYDQLLARTVEALPKVRLVLCEPFGLPSGNRKERWKSYLPELLKRQAVVERLAHKYHATLVHLQPVFDRACDRAPADYWIWDGVHPTAAGHQLIADEWVRTVQSLR